MKDFHGFVKKLLAVWLSCYAVILLPGLLKGLVMYIISDFTMPGKHYSDIINTIHIGALWLIPTAFLLVSFLLSRPGKRLIQS
jgi:hypothetical protein